MSLFARIARHWAQPASYHRKMVVGFLSVLGFVVVAKLVGAAKEVVLAWRYGTSAQVDAYVFLFNFVTWPVAVWFSLLMVVLVPLLGRLRLDSEASARRFLQELSGLNLLLAFVVTTAMVLALPMVLQRWSGLNEQALSQALAWARPLAVLCGMGMVTALQSVLILSGDRHHNSLLEAVPSLVLLAALLMPLRWSGEPMLWGSVLGFAAHLLCASTVLRLQGGAVWPRLGWRSPAWGAFRSGIGTMLAAQALASSTVLLDQWLAAPMGSGAISTLSYANRLLMLLLGVGAMALGRATLPVLSQAQAVEDPRVQGVVTLWVQWTLLAGVVVVLVVWPLAHVAVRLLFERGAFTPADTAAVAQALQFGLLQVPAYFAWLVLISHFSSLRRYGPLLAAGVVGMVAKLGVAWWLAPQLGLVGIMLSSAAFYAAGLVLLLRLKRAPWEQ